MCAVVTIARTSRRWRCEAPERRARGRNKASLQSIIGELFRDRIKLAADKSAEPKDAPLVARIDNH